VGRMIMWACGEGEVARGGIRMGLRGELFAEEAHHVLAPSLHRGLAERSARAKEPAAQVR
jgi:hypothetical protein